MITTTEGLIERVEYHRTDPFRISSAATPLFSILTLPNVCIISQEARARRKAMIRTTEELIERVEQQVQMFDRRHRRARK